MKNKFNIEDTVNVIIPGLNPDGVKIKIDSMQVWSDGVIHYGGKYDKAGVDGTPYKMGVQFIEDQCVPLVTKLKEKTKGRNNELPKETPIEDPKQLPSETPIEEQK